MSRPRLCRTALSALTCLALAGTALPAAGAAAPGTAPGAPVDLTVGDRTAPMNVEGAPAFGWLPQDRDPGEVQTAYQLQVVHADTGAVVWDSGRTASGQQSYVAYGGPALEVTEQYRWTVRTWDRTGRMSPWAAPARFETGLRDEDWGGAQWIRRTVPSTPRVRDQWTLARTETALRGEVVQARSYVASSHQYELSINGRRADRGQAFAYPGEGYYQAADVTDLVRGQRSLAVGALLHWMDSGQGRPAGQSGLLVRIEVEYADGSTQAITSDGTWKVTPGPYVVSALRNGEGDSIEHLDGPRRQALAGWDTPGYDASAWEPATVIGTHPVAPFTHLTGQETRLAEVPVQPVRLLTASDGTVVVDFGKVVPGRPVVRFSQGVAGRVVPMRAGFNLRADGRVDTSTLLTQGTNMSFPYTQVDGAQEYAAFNHLAFQYLEIPGAGEDISLEDVSATVVHTDVPAGKEARFDSSDQTLDDVWAMMQRSALYSVQEQFVDTPTREKGQFLGDAADISYATMQGFAERDATQQAIREFLQSQRRFWTTGADAGRYNAVYPNGDGKRDIPDYTQYFVDWVWRYYEVTGDKAMLSEAYESIRATAEYVQRHIPATGPTAGLVTDLTGGSGAYRFGIVDWPEPGRFGYDMTASARTVINALGVEVLRRTADMAEELDRPAAEAAPYRAAESALVDAMNAKLRRADGVYVDGLLADGSQSLHAGQHSTSYAIAFDVAPEADHPRLAEHLAGMGMKQGPMTAHWLLQALSDADRPDAVLRLLTNADDLGWANILRQGGSFTWEAWTLDPGSNFSQSHGWGAQAAVDVMETMLGIRLGAPGAETVRIVPPATGLEHAEGTVHTQRGPVSLDWQRTGQGMQVDLDVPVNVVARVELPAVEGRTYLSTGRSAATLVGVEGDRVVYEVGSGASRFVPVPDAAAVLAALGRQLTAYNADGTISDRTTAALRERLDRAVAAFDSGSEKSAAGLLQQFLARVENQVRGDRADDAAREALVATARQALDALRVVDDVEGG